MKMKRLLKNRRALSPVFSTILLIVIVVIGMTVAFGFFVNYVRDYQTGSGSSVLEAAEIEDVWFRHTNPNDVSLPVTSGLLGVGSHNPGIAAQQGTGPDGAFDTLTEANSGLQGYYPSSANPLGSTVQFSGSVADLQTAGEGGYMQFHSYPSAYSGTYHLGYDTKGGSQQQLNYVWGSRWQTPSSDGGPASSISACLDFTSSSNSFGNTATGSSGQSIIDTIRGQRFQSPSSQVVAQDISAYIDVSDPTTFGYASTSSSTDSIENYIRGSSFSCPESGTLQSITAYIYASTTYNMKAAIYNDGTNTKVAETAERSVSSGTRWVTFTFTTSPSVTAGNSYVLVVWSQSRSSESANLYYHSGGSTQGHYDSETYGSWPSTASFTHESREYSIYCTYTPRSHNVKAAIYSDSPYTLVASTQETTVSADIWVTFNFADPKPTLTASTNYVLVVWSQSGSGSVNLAYSSASGGNGRYATQTYGTWPGSLSFSPDSYQYCVHCDYLTTCKAKAAIYTETEEKTLTTVDGWVTFNFPSPPTLTASTNYVLVVYTSDTNAYLYYDSGSAERFRGNWNYPTWPTSITDQSSTRRYSIYCTVGAPSEYTCEVEFTGTSDTNPWSQLVWTVTSGWNTGGVTVTLQLYNYNLGGTGGYPTSDAGFDSYTSSSTPNTDESKAHTIAAPSNPADFRDSSGNWKLKIKGVKTTTTQFDCRVDLAEYKVGSDNFVLNLPEQWTGADYSEINEELCIYMGTLPSNENLIVQVQTDSQWTIGWTLASGWNNYSVSSYLTSSTFTIRFVDANPTGDASQTSWPVDCVLLHTWSPLSNSMEVWLYNYGKIDLKISNAYVDGILLGNYSTPINVGEHNSLRVTPTGGWTSGKTYHLKLVTTRGSASEGDFVAP
jgi:flagellin-like protein